MRIRGSLILGALTLVAVSGGVAQDDNDKEVRRDPLARALLGERTIVEVVRERVVPAARDPVLVPSRYREPGELKSAPGNLAFLGIVRGTTDKLLWVAYDRRDEGDAKAGLSEAFPRPVWSADVAWDPRRKQALFALVRVRGPHLSVRLYSVDPGAARRVPERLDASHPETWPAASTPTASLETGLSTGRAGDIERVVLVAEKSGVLLVLERRNAVAPSLYLRFAWRTRTWSWARLVVEPARSDKGAKED